MKKWPKGSEDFWQALYVGKNNLVIDLLNKEKFEGRP